ncbi:MAG: single-stranded DNA-binding protein [Bacteroidota bacterium]|nr:single-stranded DNA-binding protein [Bacteroidota bacterium]
MNKVILIGRVGADPEKRGDNGPVVFSLATSEPAYSKADGTEVAEKTEWHSITVFSEQPKRFVEKNFKKGSLVVIEGKIHYSSYTDAQGQARKGVEIIASDARFYSLGLSK